MIVDMLNDLKNFRIPNPGVFRAKMARKKWLVPLEPVAISLSRNGTQLV
jgi:hypothetical protein